MTMVMIMIVVMIVVVFMPPFISWFTIRPAEKAAQRHGEDGQGGQEKKVAPLHGKLPGGW